MTAAVSWAELYHQQTKYAEDTIRSLPPVDMTAQPEPFKSYHSERALPLADHLPFRRSPDGGTLISSIPRSSDPLPLLSRLLYFTNGPTGIREWEGGSHLFRAAPSAGGLYPTELYVVSEGVEGLGDGLHNYLVRSHELIPVFDGQLLADLRRGCFEHPAALAARLFVVASVIFDRSTWRYHDRAYRRMLLDTGHVIGNLCLYARHESVLARPLPSFADDELNNLFFFDGRQEAVLAVIPLLEEPVNPEIAPARLRGGGSAQVVAVSGDGLLRGFHRGSSLPSSASTVVSTEVTTTPPAGARELPALSLDLSEDLERVVVGRRSTRVFSGRGISLERLSGILEFGHAPPPDEGREALCVSELLETYVVVHDVRGLDPGVYRYWPRDHRLELCRAGQFRAQSHHFCLEQELGRDAAAVVVHVADLRRGLEICGDRVYRYLHLDAGVIGQWMNLAAVRLEVGVSGIGGFYDDEINEALQLGPEHAVVYVTVLGDRADR